MHPLSTRQAARYRENKQVFTMSDETGHYGLETPRQDANYICFTLDADEDQAAQAFKERYGYWPEQILEDKGLLWLGPIKDVPPESEA
jgi:hypothetical protein